MIGRRSEVLGFDDEISAHHPWGRGYASTDDAAALSKQIDQVLANHLSYEFHGYPTDFTAPDPHDSGVQLLQLVTSGHVNHRVTLHTVQRFLVEYLAFDRSAACLPGSAVDF